MSKNKNNPCNPSNKTRKAGISVAEEDKTGRGGKCAGLDGVGMNNDCGTVYKGSNPIEETVGVLIWVWK